MKGKLYGIGAGPVVELSYFTTVIIKREKR